MDFSEYKPKDILIDDPKIVSRYERDINILHGHLAMLHAMIFILEQVVEFPFDVFSLDQPRGTGTYPIFFTVLINNFLLSAVVRIHRLARDRVREGEPFTLHYFKNWVKRNVREEYRKEFKDYVAKHDFDENSEILKRIEKARHNWGAHFTRDAIEASKIEELSVSLEDLKEALGMLEPLIQALSFNAHRSMFLIEYDPEVRHPSGVDARPDIERILDSIAREDEILNMPENEPNLWKALRGSRPEEMLAIINDYRRKFGLPEA